MRIQSRMQQQDDKKGQRSFERGRALVMNKLLRGLDLPDRQKPSWIKEWPDKAAHEYIASN
jgi:hypothetical protein